MLPKDPNLERCKSLNHPEALIHSLPREVGAILQNFVHRKYCAELGFQGELTEEWVKMSHLLSYIETLHFYRSFVNGNKERHNEFLSYLKRQGIGCSHD